MTKLFEKQFVYSDKKSILALTFAFIIQAILQIIFLRNSSNKYYFYLIIRLIQGFCICIPFYFIEIKLPTHFLHYGIKFFIFGF